MGLISIGDNASVDPLAVHAVTRDRIHGTCVVLTSGAVIPASKYPVVSELTEVVNKAQHEAFIALTAGQGVRPA